MKIRFEKMSGAGNDFVVVDNRNGEVRDGPLLPARYATGTGGLVLMGFCWQRKAP